MDYSNLFKSRREFDNKGINIRPLLRLKGLTIVPK